MIPVDFVDPSGRRYMEVPVFPSGRLRSAFKDADPDPCVECGTPVRHGFDRYFQRNDRQDGEGSTMMDALLGATYDTVCGACGDRLIAKGSL